MPIKTFKGKLAMGVEEKINLSTNNGLTGYRIKNLQVITSDPTDTTYGLVCQVFLTSQTGSIGPAIDFNNSDLLGVAYSDAYNDFQNGEIIIFDKETFNQDIFINITDSSGGTTPANFYIELEQFKLDLNESTYHTVKNIRSSTQA